MKRSSALQPLSREHHQALRIAQILRRAEDADEARAAFLEFWRREGKNHFRVEEEVLLPMWGLLGTVDHEAAAKLAREHLLIRRSAMEAEARRPSLQQLQALGEQLAAHVRFEERELFVSIEQDLGDDDLELLAAAVSEAESAIPPRSGHPRG